MPGSFLAREVDSGPYAALSPAQARAVLDIESPEFYAAVVSAARSDPGLAQTLFTSSLTGKSSNLLPISIGEVASLDTFGTVWQVAGADFGASSLNVAPRADIPVRDGLVYRVRVGVQRITDPTDPLSDGVEVRIQNLTKAHAHLSNVRYGSAYALEVADGALAVEFTASRNPPTGVTVDYTFPATARYFRPYVQVYGGAPQVTAVAFIEVLDITEVAVKTTGSAIGGALDDTYGTGWRDGGEGGGTVNKVNEQTGDVSLDTDDIPETAARVYVTPDQRDKIDTVAENADVSPTGSEIASSIDIENATAASAFSSGDKLLIWEAGVGNRQIDYDDLPGAEVSVVSRAAAEAGTSTVVGRWTPELVGQAINALGGKGNVDVRTYDAVADDSTNYATEVQAAATAAAAASANVAVPAGVVRSLTEVSDVLFVGPGQMRFGTTDADLRAPYHTRVVTAANQATHTGLDRFSGDLRGPLHASTHLLSSSENVAPGTSGSYLYYPEYAQHHGYFLVQDGVGYNQNTDRNGPGRSGLTPLHLTINHGGQGDAVGYTSLVFVSGQEPGQTHFLAGGAGANANGQTTAGNDHVYLQNMEFRLADNGYDVAGISAVFNLERTVATAAQSEQWQGVRIQSKGTEPIDCGVNVSGLATIGFDTTNATMTGGAAVALAANQRISYAASSSVDPLYGGTARWVADTSLDAVYTEYNSTDMRWRVGFNGGGVFDVGTDHARFQTGSDSQRALRAYGNSATQFVSLGQNGNLGYITSVADTGDSGNGFAVQTTASGLSTPATAFSIQPNGNASFANNLQVMGNAGFYGASPVAKPTVTGSAGTGAAATSIAAALETLGLVTDSTSAGGGGAFDENTTFTTFSGATTRSLVQRYGFEPINVLDFGADPTGSGSSTSAFNAAFAELRSYASGTGTAGGRLVIPHNRHASQSYVIDGNGVNATDLRGDGLVMIEAWGARITGDMNSGLPMFDTSHSQGFTWFGGTLIGDASNPPRVGLQLTRKYTGPPTGNNTNPSSQGHVLLGLATTGQFTVAPMLNYGSEELYAAFCRFENEYDSDTSFAIVQNGMHDTDYLPTSAYDTVGWGEFTGFANNVFHKCFFLHNSGSNGGPGVYLFRASGHHYDAALAQVRENNPHFLIPHIAGEGTNACRDVTISGRYEDSGANSLLYFTGDAGAIHHGFRVKIDRMFAQSLAMADSTWTDGAGVALEDVDFRISNVTPQAVGANPAGYAQIFRNKAKFAHVTGNITVSQRSNAASTYVDIRDFDIAQFNGTLKVSDRDEIPALPGGNFRLYDDTDRQAVDYQTEITYTTRLRDTSGDLSSTTVSAKTWRVGDMLHVLFRDLNSISIAGMTGTDAARIILPVACADEDFVTGRVVLTNVSGVPAPTGAILDVRVDVGTGNSYATLRMCDSGTGTTAEMTVSQFDGANIREFKVEYKVA